MTIKAGHTRRRVALALDTSGGANPADADGTDINKIMAKFKKTGTLPNVAQKNPLYGDFTFPEDIHSVREAVERAEDRFMDLPADVRSVCKNDWVQFYELFKTTEGQEILTEAGLEINDSTITTSPETSETPDPTETETTVETPTEPNPIPNP